MGYRWLAVLRLKCKIFVLHWNRLLQIDSWSEKTTGNLAIQDFSSSRWVLISTLLSIYLRSFDIIRSNSICFGFINYSYLSQHFLIYRFRYMNCIFFWNLLRILYHLLRLRWTLMIVERIHFLKTIYWGPRFFFY